MDPKLFKCGEKLLKDLHVLNLCIQECGKGSILERNPYIRCTRVKRKLIAMHEAIERSIQSILLFSAKLAEDEKEARRLPMYYQSYAFLFAFNDEIQREEYDHLILIQNQDIRMKFEKLIHHTQYIMLDLRQREHKEKKKSV